MPYISYIKILLYTCISNHIKLSIKKYTKVPLSHMNIFMVQNPRHPKICDVCHKHNQEEPEPSAFWGQICCAEHYNDNTLRCRECLRFKQGDSTEEYVDLGDGRKLWSDCYVIEAVRAFLYVT